VATLLKHSSFIIVRSFVLECFVSRKIRLQVKDQTERRTAELQEAHRDKVKKLQKQLDDQMVAEESKIRLVELLISGLWPRNQ